MGDLSEQAKSLLEVLQTCHEEADLKEPYIKHFLKKLTDGRIEITEQNTDQYIQILKELRTTLIELSTSVNKLTKLVDDGLKLLETFEDKPQSCKSLKPASYENDDNLLVAELRDQKTRGRSVKLRILLLGFLTTRPLEQEVDSVLYFM